MPMPRDASTKRLDIDVLVVVRELSSGDRMAFPAADPDLVAYGTESSCLEELRLFLGEHLAELPALALQRFMLPDDAELRIIEVMVPRDELPRRLGELPPVAVPCLVIPSRRSAWEVTLPLREEVGTQVPPTSVTSASVTSVIPSQRRRQCRRRAFRRA